MVQASPTFSIGIPAYKDKYLKKCIQSILNQTYKNYEIIIINDCSPKDLAHIVKNFEDPRIRYYENNQNIGAENVVKNWNKCLELANGDFFVLMGDDDIMAPNYLEEFYNLINKYSDLDVFHCRTLIIDEEDNPISLTCSWPEFENTLDNIWHRISARRNQYISDFVYRTEHLLKCKGFFFLPLAWGSDDITSYRACANKGIAHTNQELLKYRSSRHTISSTGDLSLKLLSTIRYYEWLQSFIDEIEKNDSIEINKYKIIKKDLFKYRDIAFMRDLGYGIRHNLSSAIKSIIIIRNNLPYKKIKLIKMIIKEILRI